MKPIKILFTEKYWRQLVEELEQKNLLDHEIEGCLTFSELAPNFVYDLLMALKDGKDEIKFG